MKTPIAPRPPVALLAATLTVAVAVVASGCASVRSVKQPDNPASLEGMAYSLPRQKLLLTLVVPKDDTQPSTLTVAPTVVFADADHRYVALYRRNQIGSNRLKVAVNAAGVLSGETEGRNTPKIAEFLGQLAASTIKPASPDGPSGCDAPGTYAWAFDADVPLSDQSQPWSTCNITVTLTSLWSQAPNGQSKDTDLRDAGAGFFYRQKRPVQVDVQYGNQHLVFVLPVVDRNSPIGFLPIPRTLFADATWQVTFDEGSPVVYDVESGGDVLGLVKLPADVLHAYSTALLAGLGDRQSLAEKEAGYLEAVANLAAQQAEYRACQAAVRSGDDARIKAACR